MEKKAQAAMEFLLTYGWAILVVLLVIAALAYFGVLSPSRFLPETCDNFGPLTCQDYQIKGTEVNLVLINSNPNAITIDPASVVSSEDFTVTCPAGPDVGPVGGTPSATHVVPSGERVQVGFSGCSVSASEGTKVKATVTLHYTDKSSGFEHTASGDLRVEIEGTTAAP